MVNKALFTSDSEEWATPQKVFDDLNKEFNFTLDPCATPENAKCRKYYTKVDNGLLMSWKGERVFCNPPYGRQLPKWVKKSYEEVQAGGGGTCCFAHSCKNGHVLFSRLYLWEIRSAFFTRTITF